jgi:hypothetical protein
MARGIAAWIVLTALITAWPGAFPVLLTISLGIIVVCLMLEGVAAILRW